MVTTLFEFDRAQTRVERWLNISLISLAFVAIGAILYTIPIAWLPAVSSNSSILAIGFLIIGILIAWFFFRRGHQALAAGAIIATLFAIPTYLNFVVYQTIHSPDIWLYFIIIPLTGLLLGRKHMSYFTLLCLLSATALFFLEYYGFVTPTFTVYTNVNDFAILVVSLSLNTVLLYIIIRRAEDKTAEAQRSLQTLLTTHHQLAESRQALQYAHAQLELRVQERTQELQVANRSLQNEVAARQNLMDALRHSEANWRSLVQNAPELIATLTIDGTILFVNRPVRGQQVDELIGLPIAHLHHSQEHQQNLQQALAQLLVTGQSVSYESDEECEGRRTWAVNRLGPIYQGNTISALILISTDITEQKEAEMAMLHSQKLESLGIMAGGVAHDFNNLLAAIVGQASLGLIKLERDSQSVEEHLHNILRAGQRATDLTRQMLNYAGRSVAEFQLLDLGQLLHENIHFFSASISKQIQIQGPQTSELPAITGDAGQVQQLVMNLILNAADAIGEGAGTITVSTRQYQLSLQEAHEWKLTGEQLAAGTYVMLEIADDGCGMDSDTLKKIFDPFFTTKFTGKGLGLASVIGIVRTHHGGLQVKSAPGIGTTFRILFPTPETLPNRTIPTIPVEPAIE
ncbi:MAG TPA: ATP-binding protein, partial [Caldilineaceae bacterium]|nr:ATP-binding protein [Caldilineaceae bacterium]